jgi:hypothetical protein
MSTTITTSQTGIETLPEAAAAAATKGAIEATTDAGRLETKVQAAATEWRASGTKTEKDVAADADATLEKFDTVGAIHLVVLTGLNGQVGGRHLDRTMPQFPAARVHHVSNPWPMCSDFGQEACMAPLDCVMQRLHRDPTVGGIILYGASQGSATVANYLGLEGAATMKIRAVVLEAAAASGNLTVASAVSLRNVPLLGELAPIVAGLSPLHGLLGYSAVGPQPIESVRHWPKHMLGDKGPPVFILQADIDRETPIEGARAVAARLAAAGGPAQTMTGDQARRVYFFTIPGHGHANCLWQPPLPDWYHPSAADIAILAISAAASAQALADFHRLLALHRLPYDSALACRDPAVPGDADAHTELVKPSVDSAGVTGFDVFATAVPNADDMEAAADRRIFTLKTEDLDAVDAITRRDTRVRYLLRLLEVGVYFSLAFATFDTTVNGVLLYMLCRWFTLLNLVVRVFKQAFAKIRLGLARRTALLPADTHAVSALGAIVVVIVTALVWLTADSAVAGLDSIGVIVIGLLMLPQSVVSRRGTDVFCPCHAPTARSSANGGDAPVSAPVAAAVSAPAGIASFSSAASAFASGTASAHNHASKTE